MSELQTGDVILIKPGEQVPVDGKIIKGATTVDESMLTGESLPIEKKMDDDNVIAGALNQEGSLTVETKNTGEGTYLSKVIELVSEAQASKSKTQNFSESCSKNSLLCRCFCRCVDIYHLACIRISAQHCYRTYGDCHGYFVSPCTRTCSALVVSVSTALSAIRKVY